jgi:glycosyltransferase involved in cell wall biosynthesis
MVELSVVTVFKFGDISAIKRTVDSVKSQRTLPHEHILVISGVKNEELLKAELSWSRAIFVLNKDKSIYDAMNIGLSMASGNAITFLNGGDEFAQSNAVGLINKSWDSRSCLCFRVALRYKDDLYFRPKIGKIKGSEKFPSHQGFVAPLPEARERYFDSEKKPITADFYWMNLLMRKCGYKFIPAVLSIFTLGGISNTPTIYSVISRFKERDPIRGFKESIKFILFKIIGKKLFYKMIYFNKYTYCSFYNLKQVLLNDE